MATTSESIDQIPPGGDFKKAEEYINKLTRLMDDLKVTAHHTDLSKFNLNTFEDHYWIDLKEYQIEVSHSKQPNTGDDTFMMVFTNLQKIRQEIEQSSQECTTKIILAYTRLNNQQFHRFKTSAENQLNEIKRQEEEKRFTKALAPIDQLLDSAQTQAPEIPAEESAEEKAEAKDEASEQLAPETQEEHSELKEYDINPSPFATFAN